MATFHERITGPKGGQGQRVVRNPNPPKEKHTKHFVGTDHLITEEEALEMGRALFDAIAAQQARIARQDGD